MSPLSFLSSFAFPSWSSIPSIGSYIPENIQKRLVSYLLQRTLGKFVKQDGLQLEGIEAAINQGRVRLDGLQIDTEGVNATLPADFPYRFREGQLDSIDISLPFPNLWSGALSLGISSIQLTLESRPVEPWKTSASDDPQEWNIDKSIYAASTDFVRTVLNKDEDDQLQSSMYNMHLKESERNLLEENLDPFATDESPQAPGHFPGSFNAFDGKPGGTAGLVESMMEALLARLQVSVGEIVVKLHHEVPARAEETASCVDLELKIEGIRYALHQSETDALPKKTLTVDDVGVWMSSEKILDQEQTSTSPNTVREVEDDMMMSLGIADLRESRYGVADMETRLQSPGSEEDNPAESLYESAIGEDTPTASPTIRPSAKPRASTDSSRDVRNKIFGLRRRGIVVQMWKEPVDVGEDTASEGSPIAQARISVDLGNLAVALTSEQVKSLILVAGSFPASQQAQQSEHPTHAVRADKRRGSTPQCRILANQVDLHYFYGPSVAGVSQSVAYWNRTDHEEIKEENLHLQLLNLQIIRREQDVSTISLSHCALVDAYRHVTRGDEPLRRQPILLIGKPSEQIWLPCEEDARQEVSLAAAEELDNEAQISLSLSEPGRTLLLRYIRLYLDPSRLEHSIRSLQQLLSVYNAASDAPRRSNVTRGGSDSTSAAALRLDIRMLSTRIYNAPCQGKAVPRAIQIPGRVGLDASGILLERSIDGAIQARMDWMKADLSGSNSADPQTWFTCGNVTSSGDPEKALDFDSGSRSSCFPRSSGTRPVGHSRTGIGSPSSSRMRVRLTGGEGLGVAPTTVDSDQASLERMVLDLGRDHYHLQGEALTALQEKVRHGNMEDVLKVYEEEMKSPLKNAVLGSLIRTLLIQVQKTKTDLSLSLLSLDHLLRSQQLTFAFVGLAPSLLVLYGLGGWFRRVWNGENRGKTRRMAYVRGVRDIERLLLTTGKVEQEMTDRDRGLLLLSVGGMRAWAAGLRGQHKEDFMDDLRLLENAKLGRKGKLRVVDRIWRGWGVNGRGTLGK
ncbi:hypothetical protein QFC20_000504 [Naganishia adeliensis]|uniref:Uncharacterized protein n=1 Tax=Naganishia adeliensis TaxID=92952 RepID=A0ACC2WY29_9TREE|nr:hypothetical protein QFC20_000504 [Naganishia adeliensis]